MSIFMIYEFVEPSRQQLLDPIDSNKYNYFPGIMCAHLARVNLKKKSEWICEDSMISDMCVHYFLHTGSCKRQVIYELIFCLFFFLSLDIFIMQQKLSITDGDRFVCYKCELLHMIFKRPNNRKTMLRIKLICFIKATVQYVQLLSHLFLVVRLLFHYLLRSI